MPANRKPLRGEAHRQRHRILHRALDELAADWAMHNSRPSDDGKIKVFSNTTIMELIEWSHKQTIQPDEDRG